MIGRIISALVGREMGRRSGGSGGGYAAKKAYDRNRARKSGY